MGLLQALQALRAIELAITIPEDVRLTIEGLSEDGAKIQEAYLTIPDESIATPTVPCFLNIYTVLDTRRTSGLLETDYNVNIQLLVRDSQQGRGALIATAFWDAINAAFDTAAVITLNGTVSNSGSLVGANPTLVGWAKSGGPFVGLNLNLGFTIKLQSDR